MSHLQLSSLLPSPHAIRGRAFLNLITTCSPHNQEMTLYLDGDSAEDTQ